MHQLRSLPNPCQGPHHILSPNQMSPALMSVTQASITAGKYLFKASGTKVIFSGYMVVYRVEPKKDSEERRSEAWKIPVLTVGEILNLVKLTPSQHFTKPPPRYSDASLVKDLEDKGEDLEDKAEALDHEKDEVDAAAKETDRRIEEIENRDEHDAGSSGDREPDPDIYNRLR